MFRLLLMNNMRNLSVISSVSSSQLRRSCPLCNNHINNKTSGKASIYDGRGMIGRLSVMTIDLNSREVSALQGEEEEVEELMEELEEVRLEPELVDSFISEALNTISTVDTVRLSSVKTLKKQKGISKANREIMAKVKISELERAGKERNLNHNLDSYLEISMRCGLLNRGLGTLIFYLSRKKNDVRITNIEIFNRLLEGYARLGNVEKVNEVWSLLEKESLKPNINSFAYQLEAIVKSTVTDKIHLIKSTINLMGTQGLKLDDIFNVCQWRRDSREAVMKAIRAVQPRFTPRHSPTDLSYSSNLLIDLNNNPSRESLKADCDSLFSNTNLNSLFEEQLDMESKFYIDVKSIEKSDRPCDNYLKYREKLEELKESWSRSIVEGLERDLATMSTIQKNLQYNAKLINIYPYLIVLDVNDYKDILLHEIRKLAEGSETFSPTVGQLYKDIGNQVKIRYEKKIKFEDGVIDKVRRIYGKYMEWYKNPTDSKINSCNPRHQWQLQVFSHQHGPTIDRDTNPWPYPVLHAIGKFLYKIILRDIKIDFNIFRNNQPPQLVPGFYPVFRHQGHMNKEEVKPHPVLSRLYRAACLPHLTFSVSELPMLAPPLPWTSLTSGGYIISTTNIVRLPHQAVQQWERLKSASRSQLYPTFDSLNQLAAVPWIVNTKALDIVIQLFNSGGCSKLDIPEPPSSCNLTEPLPPLPSMQPKSEKYLAYRQRMLVRRRKAEMYSLWCDALYRLSLANHFRDRVFWLPHNMDFRGRVYPCPPHLNHLGSDMARSLLMFASGKPLGPRGFDWLKIHLVNLTGLKKRESIEERLKYADEIMSDILDSAADPLGGRKWWMESEEPWQTLACCMEIKQAMECPLGVESYVCHFPVHQDGSCNGLQHYAALGRDSAGAQSVNLSPSPIPQDVYTCVSNIVEKERAKDAENGVKVAKVLEGFVKRKVIKQTVMTTVYGVTKFGARLQIAKQLKDIDDFPKEYVWQASTYLVFKTFASLRQMFTSTREIQDWFTESARMISQVCGQNVEYVTPLGLPVVQPYYRYKPVDHKKFSLGNIVENAPVDMFERPNVLKQKNAFPPNFIHSLDSTHMMLTSLHCQHENITFVSVHDCYWTHPSTVSIMNRICREQFVALHSEPILQDLSDFLVKKYSYSEECLKEDVEAIAVTKRKLNSLLTQIPPTGDFNLNQVLKSVYFFS